MGSHWQCLLGKNSVLNISHYLQNKVEVKQARLLCVYFDIAVTLLHVIQMFNKVHLIDFAAFYCRESCVEDDWTNFQKYFNCVQPVGLCIMVTPKLLYDPVLAVRSYIVAMIYCHTVTLAYPGPP